jgi:hypothetical protein
MTKWCWLCQETGIDYSHFNAANGKKCANKLWEATNEDHEAQVRAALEDNNDDEMPGLVDVDGPAVGDINVVQGDVGGPIRPPILRQQVNDLDPWNPNNPVPQGWE